MGSWNARHQLAVDLVSGTRQIDKAGLRALLGACPVCRGTSQTPIIGLHGVPVLSCRLWDDWASARNAPTGSMEIVSCNHCGNIYNRAFDPGLILYDQNYENSLEHSSTHRNYLAELATNLVERFGLANRTVIEVGVGSGYLLRFMAERFGITGIGFDPGVSDAVERFASGGSMRLVNGFFATFPEPIDSDLVACLHLLEHLVAPWALLRQIRDRHLPRTSRIYLEVPNGRLLYNPSGIWDLIYEHVSHFTAQSLRHVTQSEGFRIVDSGTSFGDQYLWLIAESNQTPAPLPKEDAVAKTPAISHAKILEDWRDKVRQWTSNGTRVALWGAGAKGSTFANLLDPAGEIFSVFDINPKKWNRYIPVSGHCIQAPHQLPSCHPDIVIAMNPLYTREITQMVRQMCSSSRVISIGDFERARNERCDRPGRKKA